jgi:hypothetical protein
MIGRVSPSFLPMTSAIKKEECRYSITYALPSFFYHCLCRCIFTIPTFWYTQSLHAKRGLVDHAREVEESQQAATRSNLVAPSIADRVPSVPKKKTPGNISIFVGSSSKWLISVHVSGIVYI